MTDLRPFLFVHGGWHGPWRWQEHWTSYFERAGHRAEAIQLSSHDRPGSRRRIWSTLGGHVAEVRERLAELGPRTVLVGHSMGGLIVQRALEDLDVSRAAGAVLLASVPRRGAIPATLRLARREPLTVLRVLTTISMWPIVRSEARARRAFFSPGAPQEIVEATFQRLQNESFRSFVNMLVRPPRPSRVRTPVHVIAAELDWFLTHGEQRDLAEAYESELKIIAGGHDLMLDRSWTEAADEVLRWAASLDRAPPEPYQDLSTCHIEHTGRAEV